MTFKSILLSAVFVLAGCISAFAGVNIIPYPQSVEMTETVFNKKNIDKVKFVKSKELPSEAYELQILKNIKPLHSYLGSSLITPQYITSASESCFNV